MAKKLTFKKKSNKEREDSKKKPILKFPRISRIIPDKSNESFVFCLAIIFILISVVIVGLDLYQNINLQKRLIGQTDELQRKLSFWESEVEKHPNFRDAYFNLAIVEYQLKDFSSSRTNLENALKIDPNFEKGRKFQEILSGSL